MITDEEYRAAFNYNLDTGDILWRITGSSKALAGSEAGYISNGNGYRYIGYKNRAIRAHRLAYILMGETPPATVDHKDRDPSNNAWDNLRGVTSHENAYNRKSKVGRSGIKGIRFHANRYEAQITHLSKTKTKRFLSIEDAKAWLYERREALHGEYAKH